MDSRWKSLPFARKTPPWDRNRPETNGKIRFSEMLPIYKEDATLAPKTSRNQKKTKVLRKPLNVLRNSYRLRGKRCFDAENVPKSIQALSKSPIHSMHLLMHLLMHYMHYREIIAITETIYALPIHHMHYRCIQCITDAFNAFADTLYALPRHWMHYRHITCVTDALYAFPKPRGKVYLPDP